MRALSKRLPRHWQTGDFEARFLYYAPRYLLICVVGFAVTSFFVSHAYLDPIYILAALMAGTFNAVAAKLRREPQSTAQLPTIRSRALPASPAPNQRRQTSPAGP